MQTRTAEPAAAERRTQVKTVLDLIGADAKDDAQKIDGTPFDARGVGENFGKLYAAVEALANVCTYLLAELEALEAKVGVDR